MFVSVGDRADVSTSDLLEWCEDDERTAAVMLYVETFGNPGHFTRIAQRVSRKKPILALNGRRNAGLVPANRGSDTAAALRGDAVAEARCVKPGCCGSAAARSCSTPPCCSRASRCRAARRSAS